MTNNRKNTTDTPESPEPTDTEDPMVDETPDEMRLKDISHTPSHGDGAERVWDGTRVRPRDDDDE